MEPLRELREMLARALPDELGPDELARQRQEILQMSRRLRASERGQRARWPWRWLIPAACAATLLVLWSGWRSPRGASLLAAVDNRPFSAGSSLSANSGARTIEFSDRSRASLSPGSVARLVAVEAADVRLVLEHGRLDLAVRPNPARAWRVFTGPYTVEVTGTEFSVAWQPEMARLAVDVTEGSVLVRGPGLADSGELVSCGEQRRFGADPTPLAPAVLARDCGPACDTPSPDPAPARPHPMADWRRLAKRGEHAAAFAAAEREGLGMLLNRLDPGDLELLAHSARVAGDVESARRVLLTLRRKFPQHALAARAAYVSARIALDLGDCRTAVRWLETYLGERFADELADEARGHLLRCWGRLGETARAQAAAHTYLEHHPQGASAESARRLLARPQ